MQTSKRPAKRPAESELSAIEPKIDIESLQSRALIGRVLCIACFALRLGKLADATFSVLLRMRDRDSILNDVKTATARNDGAVMKIATDLHRQKDENF